jgi:alginate O-acetyltransferase complex protein AlgI
VVFSSPTFLYVFLPVLLAAYALCPRAARGALLLAASLFFYAWGEPTAVLVLVAASLAGWLAAAWAARAEDARARRRRTGLGVGAVLLPLLGFKYLGWLAEELSGLALAIGVPAGAALDLPPIALPIGISFFTFQIMSYVLDVGAGHTQPQRRFSRFLLYVALFPQLVAGPIVRYVDIERDIDDRRLDWGEVGLGLRRFATGLAKKVLVADQLGYVADSVFLLDPSALTTGAAWFGLVAYTLQIYFDFSGYSDMAIGLGHVFGFRFLENFRHPYAARSVTEFWRRWHISLSSWFRDYVYIPLGGNRGGALRTARNLWSVFLLCGLWHGAAWNFVVWGAWHGMLLVGERALGIGRGAASGLRGLFGWVFTLLAVMVGWVLFRAEDMPQAIAFLERLAVDHPPVGGMPLGAFWTPALLPPIGLALATVLPLPAWLRARIEERFPGRRVALALDGARAAVLLALTAWAMAEVAASTHSPFLYFRF